MNVKKVRKAIIPAAGLGTRFLPATKALPKEMIPIVDKPAIQYIVEEALAAGIEEILIVIGRDKAAIEDHFDKSYELEKDLEERGKTGLLQAVSKISDMADIHYIRQKSPLGLGHAVNKGRVFAEGEPVAVLLPDEIMDCRTPCIRQMIDVYEEYACTVLGVLRVPESEVENYGIVKGEELEKGLYRVIDMVEKPKREEAPSDLAIIGRYVITPEIFEALSEIRPGAGGELQLTDALRLLHAKQGMLARTVEGSRYDSGSKAGFLQATVELALKREDVGPEFRAYLRRMAEEGRI
ncbi:UTP--glucose-1-phosphate uridylyltransferase GalU [Bacilliculturomica massiliensis]|uniref:UTP--glucose-1-phosphate uridylyltransferase GalU n=1 Tax=Bacilliculturomica massiliensis TaxID=1917867 RepID=UPI001030BCC5|nr:UTP--glucose-1-phosphate uridylyltransferase GalU [Bacilliculturomica massiliensis]